MLTFLDDSLGKEVGLLDHESRQWRGIITTPAAQLAEVTIGHNVSLEFQGALV